MNSTLRWLAVMTVASLAAACATLSPQIFSDDVLNKKGGVNSGAPQAPGPVSVPDAIAEAQEVRGKYIAAFQDLSEITPRTNAALLALGALTLIKGFNSGSASDMAAAGVVGSAAYLYASSSVSKPRQRVYLEGAKALSCAIDATLPWNIADSGELAGALKAASEAMSNLDLALQRYQPAVEAFALPTAAPRQRPACPEPQPSCPPSTLADAGAKAEAQRICANAIRNWTVKCAPIVSAKPKESVPHPDTEAAYLGARVTRALVSQRINTTALWIDKLNQAGGQLRSKSAEIQFAVASQVLETEPDVSSILSSVGSLRDVGQRLTGAQQPIEPVVRPQGASSNRVARDADFAAIHALTDATRVASDAAARLDLWDVRLRAVAQRVKNGPQQCRVATVLNALTVNPPDEQVMLAIGKQQVFYVFGGTGVAVGSIAGEGKAGPGSLFREIDQQGVRFTFTPDASAQPGDVATVRFTDAAGAGARSVTIQLVANTAGGVVKPHDTGVTKGVAGQASTGTGGNTIGSTFDPKNEDLKYWLALGFTGKSDDQASAFVQRLMKCQQKSGATPSGVPDPATRKFMLLQTKPCANLT